MPLNTWFALAQPYMVKLTIDFFLDPRSGDARRVARGRFMNAAGSHGLLVMGGDLLCCCSASSRPSTASSI